MSIQSYDLNGYAIVGAGAIQAGDLCGVEHAGKPLELLGPVSAENNGRDISTFSPVWRFFRQKAPSPSPTAQHAPKPSTIEPVETASSPRQKSNEGIVNGRRAIQACLPGLCASLIEWRRTGLLQSEELRFITDEYFAGDLNAAEYEVIKSAQAFAAAAKGHTP